MVAPQLPSSGWQILYLDAFTRFLAGSKNLPYAGPVSDWIVACRAFGPPPDGVEAGDDFYLSRVMDTPVVAEYLIVLHEFLIICKEFR